MNSLWLLSVFYLVLCLTVTGQESVEFLALHEPTETLHASTRNGLPVAVLLENEYIKKVSNNVLMAETWVKAHVLAYYPASNISSVLVGHSVLCNKDEETNLGLVLPSIKNIHYSLTRWGLQNDIKVSASFSSDCLNPKSDAYRADLAESYIKPLLLTLHKIGSPYVVNPPQDLPAWSDEHYILLKSHSEAIRNLGVSQPKKINVIVSSPRNQKLSTRKLLFIDYNNMKDPFPPRPTPVAPTHSPSGLFAPRSSPAPLVGTAATPLKSSPFAPSLPPDVNLSPPFLPDIAPMANPASPPYGPHFPPCSPPEDRGFTGSPIAGVHDGVWCVAKPSVPPETLKEALDYACGEGAADCDAIRSQGSCYFPDSLVAHASYAFNSYWQKTKKNGGTCGFGGTAMLVNSDPSYRHCRFILA